MVWLQIESWITYHGNLVELLALDLAQIIITIDDGQVTVLCVLMIFVQGAVVRQPIVTLVGGCC